MKIVVTQTRAGLWAGQVQNGWDVVHTVDGHDREQVLLKLLALIDMKVVYEGEHWINGQYAPWKVENV